LPVLLARPARVARESVITGKDACATIRRDGCLMVCLAFDRVKAR